MPTGGAIVNSGSAAMMSQFSNQALNRYGWTALHAACYFGHISLVRYLIIDQCADVNAVNINGWHSLIFAVYGGHLDIVDYLLFESPCTPKLELTDFKNKRTA